MAGSAYSGEGAMISDINVTPLVDVVLVLLIVMMITMPTIITTDILNERQMDVQLPQASEAKPLISKPKELVVNVDRNGNYIAKQEPRSPQALLDLLRQEQSNNPGRASVIIRADKQCAWQAVMSVMDMCNKAGIRDYHVSAIQ